MIMAGEVAHRGSFMDGRLARITRRMSWNVVECHGTFVPPASAPTSIRYWFLDLAPPEVRTVNTPPLDEAKRSHIFDLKFC